MVENDSTEALEWYAENGYRLYDDDEVRKLRCEEVIEKALRLLEEEFEEEFFDAFDKVDKASEYYHSFEDMCAIDEDIDEYYVDYDTCDAMLSDMMAKEFVNSLNDNEKYILSCLLNGMTHQEISDTMDCTRQNVTRTVERLGTKAIDFLSCN